MIINIKAQASTVSDKTIFKFSFLYSNVSLFELVMQRAGFYSNFCIRFLLTSLIKIKYVV